MSSEEQMAQQSGEIAYRVSSQAGPGVGPDLAAGRSQRWWFFRMWSASQEPPWPGRLLLALRAVCSSAQAVLVAAFPWTPICAALFTLGVFVPAGGAIGTSWALAGLPVGNLLYAVLALLASWVSLALVWAVLGYASQDRANADIASDLHARLIDLKARINAPRTQDSDSWVAQTAWGMIKGHADQIEDQLKRRTHPHWVLGSGYINLLFQMHRAEETLIYVEPPSWVMGSAMYDLSRYRGSALETHDKALGDSLETAIDFLQRYRGAGSTLNLEHPGPVQGLETGLPASTVAQALPERHHDVPVTRPDGNPASTGYASSAIQTHRDPTSRGAQSGGFSPTSEHDAREMCRAARRSIDLFTIFRFSELIRTRNQLLLTATMTGMVLYSLLWIYIGTLSSDSAVPFRVLPIMSGYFMAGAMIGLFAELLAEARRDAPPAIDDFGLSLTRIAVTPILSGVSAVLSVVLMTTILALAGANKDGGFIALELTHQNFLIAAIFAMTPQLLIDQLRAQSDRYQRELEGAAAAAGARTRQ